MLPLGDCDGGCSRLFGDLFKESSRQTEMSFSPTPYKVLNPSKLRVLAVKADITGDLEALNAALSVATTELGPVRICTIWIWARICKFCDRGHP